MARSVSSMCLSAMVGMCLLATLRGSAGDVALPKAIGWRGDGTGVYPGANPPTEWDIDEKTNILWQTIVGRSQSGPVVVGDRIFVTAERDFLLCVERKSGKILWKRDNGFAALPPGEPRAGKRQRSAKGCGYSAPTPVTDGRLVYASYATGIVACYDLAGKRRWIRCLDEKQVLQYGRSASPVLAPGRLLVTISGLFALDPKTGKTLWHTKEAKPAYGTPAVTTLGGVGVAITPAGDCVRLSDGKILATEMGTTTYTSPLVSDGIVYFADATTVALRLPPRAADSIQPARLWENEDLEGEFFASPVCHGGILYCVSNEGRLYALDAKTGKLVYEKELDIPSMGGRAGMEPANIYPSLALAGQHLFLANDAGNTLVLAPGREYKQLSHNFLDKGSGASPVADGKQLFLRGGEKLYCIGRK